MEKNSDSTLDFSRLNRELDQSSTMAILGSSQYNNVFRNKQKPCMLQLTDYRSCKLPRSLSMFNK